MVQRHGKFSIFHVHTYISDVHVYIIYSLRQTDRRKTDVQIDNGRQTYMERQIGTHTADR